MPSLVGLLVIPCWTCGVRCPPEAIAEQAFAQRPGTLVVIAHRISSAMRADQILVMDGANTTLGSHRELLATNSHYTELVGYWDGSHWPDNTATSQANRC